MKRFLLMLLALSLLLCAAACGGKGDVGVDKATAAAMKHAGVKSGDALVTKCEPDTEDGKRIYDVEFTAGAVRYEYEIDAATAKVLGYASKDAAAQLASVNLPEAAVSPLPVAEESGYIGEDQAKKIALDKVPGAKETHVYKLHLDYENGRAVYEGKILYNDAEYEFDIDAVTGDICCWEEERHAAPTAAPAADAQYIGEDKAAEIALAKVPGATRDNIHKLHLDREDGRVVYEGKILYQNVEYEFDIDAVTGAIYNWETDLD